MADTTRILVKLQPSAALAAVPSNTNLRPLFASETAPPAFGLGAAPTWYLADLPTAAELPWDNAHAQVAAQLGIAESQVVMAEPDLPHKIFADPQSRDMNLAIGANCQAVPQQGTGGRVVGPDEFAWHLRDDFSQLGAARDAVTFADPRTRIAHLDTGYDKTHNARPERILTTLERNFVSGNSDPNSAQDPNRGHLFDNSGHGTGTLGILAGGRVASADNKYLGGAPQADILPLRIADSVVLFFTSAFVSALQYAIQQRADVVSISMGGLPSRAWNEQVNAAYEAGVCIVAASGDCFGGFPTHHVVYPARYHRTIAACGVMADGRPYYDLPLKTIEGNWGPNSSMTAALSTYTPNIPWAKFGCPTTIDLDGQGTSAATPQIAAAVALWYEKYKNVLPRDWRRVEAVRNALFRSARGVAPELREKLGAGILQARAALDIAPIFNLPKTPPDNDSFSFFRVITGLGISGAPAREEMFNLELTQRWLLNRDLQELVPDPDDQQVDVPQNKLRQFMEAVIEDKSASLALRKHTANRYALLFGAKAKSVPKEIEPEPRAPFTGKVRITPPPFRRLRTYAVDPSFSTRLDTAAINEAVLKIKWEKLEPGPVGEYLAVEDSEAPNNFRANLDDPQLLAQDGFAPSEGNPGFHQQMVYAVAMTTIAHFEQALGRPVFWRPKPNEDDENDDSKFVPRLKILPHAMRQANAFYSPPEIALRFGFIEASANDPGDHVPGSMVFFLPLARHHRARNDARDSGRHASPLQ
ncbi:MAG: S8 family serine peptidase [Blastocatellia bacterium]